MVYFVLKLLPKHSAASILQSSNKHKKKQDKKKHVGPEEEKPGVESARKNRENFTRYSPKQEVSSNEHLTYKYPGALSLHSTPNRKSHQVDIRTYKYPGALSLHSKRGAYTKVTACMHLFIGVHCHQ